LILIVFTGRINLLPPNELPRVLLAKVREWK
jgi:hypothetical protein